MKIPYLKIFRIEDVKPGDWLALSWKTHTISGQVQEGRYTDANGAIKTLTVQDYTFAVPERDYWVSAFPGLPETLQGFTAERPNVPLPDEVGSVIVLHSVHGTMLDVPRKAMLLESGVFVSTRAISGTILIKRSEIDLWSPVPEEDA